MPTPASSAPCTCTGCLGLPGILRQLAHHVRSVLDKLEPGVQAFEQGKVVPHPGQQRPGMDVDGQRETAHAAVVLLGGKALGPLGTGPEDQPSVAPHGYLQGISPLVPN